MRKVLMILVLLGMISACKNNESNKKAENGKDKKEQVTKNKNKAAAIEIKEGDVVIEKYANGVSRRVQTFKKVDGKLVPVYEKVFYDDGKLNQEGPLKDGKRTGHWKSYYRDGILWSEGDFVDGVAEGTTITYYPNGKKRYEGQFKNGHKEGTWKFWNEKGEFVKNVEFVPQGKKIKKNINMK